MKPIMEKSGALYNHLLKLRELRIKLNVGLATANVESGLGVVSIVSAAAGTSKLVLSKDVIGTLQEARAIEILSASGGAVVTASGSINVDGNLEIALDSDSDYTADVDSLEIRLAYKLK